MGKMKKTNKIKFTTLSEGGSNYEDKAEFKDSNLELNKEFDEGVEQKIKELEQKLNNE